MVTLLRRAMSSLALSKLKKKTPLEKIEKPKKKIDRFDGLTEEEVQKYTLPDYLDMNLDLVFVGINPSLMAAHRGRYYAGPGNHFYKLLHESGLTPPLTYEKDYKLLEYGIGLTNIVERPTRSSADLKRAEIKEGSKFIEEKLKFYKPKIAVFNGKCIYEVFANKSGKFNFGLQSECIGDTAMWVVPSSSARCANFPRMVDKLHFYTALKKYLQFLKGEIKDVDIKEFLFEGKCKQFIPSTSKMWRRKNVSAFLRGGRIANKETVCLDTSEENVAIAHSTEFIVKQIESKQSNEINNLSNTENIEMLKDLESCQSQGDRRSDPEDISSQEEPIQDANNMLHHKTVVKSTKVETDTSVKSKIMVNNHKKRAKVKRLSPKPVTTKTCLENNSSSDFISLIKQKLQEKANNDNAADEGEGIKKVQIKTNTNKSSLKSKLERFSSKTIKDDVHTQDSFAND